MPVDLSKIGLEGLESYSQRKFMDAQSEHLSSLADKNDFETYQAMKMEELSNRASQYLDDVAHRRKTAEPGEEGELQSFADPLETVADIYLRGGAVETGAELLDKASTIRKRESDMRRDSYLNETSRLENIIKGSDIVASTIGVAQNEDEWQQGLKEVEQSGLIEPELMAQLKQQQYDPDVAAYFRDRAITAKEHAELEYKNATLDQRERQNSIRNANSAKRLDLSERRLKDQQRRTDAAIKNGGGKASSAAAPSEADLNSAKAALLTGPFKGVKVSKGSANEAAFNAAAQATASRAKQLIRENKALDWETAMQQAMISLQDGGRFKVEDEELGLIDTLKDKAGLDVPRTRNIEFAPLPQKKEQLKKGGFYMTSRGRARWNGNAFEPVTE